MIRHRFLSSLFLIASIIISSAGCQKTGASSDINSNLNYKPVGASANELLSSAKPSLVVEIDYMPGFQLQASTVSSLTAFIQAYLNKPQGVQVFQKEIEGASNTTLTTPDIVQIERQNRLYYSTSKQVAVCIIVTNGVNTDANTIGFSYRNTSISLFGKTLQNFSSGNTLAFKSKLETSTIEHEFGHLLGLTNLGSPMQTNHEDVAHTGHCNNSKCLMYYKLEGSELLNYVKGGSIPGFDQNCLNDLKANGGR